MVKSDAAERSMPEINPEKVCFIAEQARELLSEDEGEAPDASNPTDDGEREILTDAAYAPVHSELVQFIDDLDFDEQCALVALVWIGRGDFDPSSGGRPLRWRASSASHRFRATCWAFRCFRITWRRHCRRSASPAAIMARRYRGPAAAARCFLETHSPMPSFSPAMGVDYSGAPTPTSSFAAKSVTRN